jgi:hypothetical protein
VFQGTREDMRKELPYQIVPCQSCPAPRFSVPRVGWNRRGSHP